MILEWLIKELSCFEPVKRVILYGSRSREDHHDRSDIDIAVDLGREHTTGEWAYIEEVIERAPTLLRIEFVFLDSSIGEELQDRVLSEGKVLYDRNQAEKFQKST